MNELPFPEATSTFSDRLIPCNTTLECSISSDGSAISQAKVACLRLLSNEEQKYCSCRSVVLGWYSGELCEDSSPLMYFLFFVEIISGSFALYQTFGFIRLTFNARAQKSLLFALFCALESTSSFLNIFWQSARVSEHIISSDEVSIRYSFISLFIFGPIAFTTLHTGASLLIWSWYNTVLSTWTFSGKMKRIQLLTYLNIAFCTVSFIFSVSTVQVGQEAPGQTYLLMLLVAIGINFYIISSIGSMVSSALSHGYGKINPKLFDILKLFQKSLRRLLRYLYCGFLIYLICLVVSAYVTTLFGDALKLFTPLSNIAFFGIRIAGFMMRQGLLRNGIAIITNFAEEKGSTLVPTKSHVMSSKWKPTKSSSPEYVDESTRPETLILESTESGSVPSRSQFKNGTNLETRTIVAREANATDHSGD